MVAPSQPYGYHIGRASRVSRRRLAVSLAVATALAVGGYLSWGTGGTSTRVVVNGQRVFRLSFPSCPRNADCTPSVVIGGRFWGWQQFSVPQVGYRGGSLYAVGRDQIGAPVAAYLIPQLSSHAHTAGALKEATQWSIAISLTSPITQAYQDKICSISIRAPSSYCVTARGFPPNS